MLPYVVVLGLAVFAGSVAQGNFSNLTSGVLAVAVPQYRGATIGLYSCIGFGAGFLGTLLFGVLMDHRGVGVLAISAGLSLSAFFALLILRARPATMAAAT